MKAEFKSNSVLTDNTVFLLRIKYSLEDIKYPAQLHSSTLAVFSNLKYAEHFLRLKDKTLYNFLAEKPWKIYEIEEIALNYFWNFVRTRFYDCDGKFYGEHVWEEENNRKKRYDHRFKKADFVEFVDGTVLHAGIVASIPPNKDTSPFKDYYTILHGIEEYSCSRVVSFNVFSLSGLITDKYKKRLRERIKKERLVKLKKVIEKNSDNTTYRIYE